MKKLFTLLVLVALVSVLAITASAELYSPPYYGIDQVADEGIVIDGTVDEAYGDPIFYYLQDGLDDPGNYKSAENWFFTQSDSEDCLFLILNEGQYAKGYAVWSEQALYLCFDVNIQGWHFNNIVDGTKLGIGSMWQAYCVQVGLFDYNNGSNIDWGIGCDADGNTYQFCFVSNNGAILPTGETNFKVASTRNGDNVIYEVEIPLNDVFSSILNPEDKVAMDICIDFCNVSEGGPQNCLTFVNANYHARNIATARSMYLLADGSRSAEELYAAEVNAKEEKSDNHSISLYPCNTAAGGMTLDTQAPPAGFGCLVQNVGAGFVSSHKFAAPVDGSKYDTLEFELFISDLALFDTTFDNTGLEITSGGKEDTEEISWTLAQIKDALGSDAKVGWNHVVLHFKDAATNGEINYSAINFMRFFMVGAEGDTGITLKIDNFRLTDALAVEAAALKAEADAITKRLNDMDEVTEENYTKMNSKVKSARKAYDNLSDAAKVYVDAAAVAKLEAAEKAIEDFKAAEEAKENEPEPDDDSEDEEQIPGEDEDTTGEDEDTTDEDEEQPEAPAKKNNTVLIVVIVVVVVVAIAGVVVVVLLKKKKA